MAPKKGKGSGKGKGNKGQQPKAAGKQGVQTQQLVPQERVNAIKPFWQTLPQDERLNLLTVDIATLRETAKQVAETAKHQAASADEYGWGADPYTADQLNIESILEEALERLQQRGTWKVWRWHLDGSEFYDAESFRQHVMDKFLKGELKDLLPKMDPKAMETAAEEGLRKRMSKLLERITEKHQQLRDESFNHHSHLSHHSYQHYSNGSGHHPPGRHGRGWRGARQTTEQLYKNMKEFEMETITMIVETLEMEHEYLSQMIMGPITGFVVEVLSDDVRASSTSDLHFEDLERLAPEQVARICEWLTEKVDSLCAQLKPDSRTEDEEEREDMGDIDLWSLSSGGNRLLVNAKWLQHLQQRLLGKDGHPRRSQPGEDTHAVGLVLEWVYGCIVSTAEKARDAAQRSLSMEQPTTERAYDCLVHALKQQQSWGQLVSEARTLLVNIVGSRRSIVTACERHGIDPASVHRPATEGAAGTVDGGSAGGAAAIADRTSAPPVVADTAAKLLGAAQVPSACSHQHAVCCSTTAASTNSQNEGPAPMPDPPRPSTSDPDATASTSSPAAPCSRTTVAADGTAAAHHVSLPDDVILAVLQRELVLTQSKIHLLWYDRLMAEKALQGLNTQLRLYEPELARLKRQLDEQKQSGSTGNLSIGTTAAGVTAGPLVGGPAPTANGAGAGTQAQLDRLLQAEGFFQIQGARLQSIHERKRVDEMEIGRKATEIQQFQSWKTTIEAIIHKMQTLIKGKAAKPAAPMAPAALAPVPPSASTAIPSSALASAATAATSEDAVAGRASEELDVTATRSAGIPSTSAPALPPHAKTLPGFMPALKGRGTAASVSPSSVADRGALSEDQHHKLCLIRTKFTSTIQPQLYADAEDAKLYERLIGVLKVVGTLMDEGQAALSHLEMQLINVACDDPGASVGLQLVLPILQQRLDLEAAKIQEAHARVVWDELIRAEEAEKSAAQQHAAAAAAAKQQQQQQLHARPVIAAGGRCVAHGGTVPRNVSHNGGAGGKHKGRRKGEPAATPVALLEVHSKCPLNKLKAAAAAASRVVPLAGSSAEAGESSTSSQRSDAEGSVENHHGAEYSATNSMPTTTGNVGSQYNPTHDPSMVISSGIDAEHGSNDSSTAKFHQPSTTMDLDACVSSISGDHLTVDSSGGGSGRWLDSSGQTAGSACLTTPWLDAVEVAPMVPVTITEVAGSNNQLHQAAVTVGAAVGLASKPATLPSSGKVKPSSLLSQSLAQRPETALESCSTTPLLPPSAALGDATLKSDGHTAQQCKPLATAGGGTGGKAGIPTAAHAVGAGGRKEGKVMGVGAAPLHAIGAMPAAGWTASTSGLGGLPLPPAEVLAVPRVSSAVALQQLAAMAAKDAAKLAASSGSAPGPTVGSLSGPLGRRLNLAPINKGHGNGAQPRNVVGGSVANAWGPAAAAAASAAAQQHQPQLQRKVAQLLENGHPEPQQQSFVQQHQLRVHHTSQPRSTGVDDAHSTSSSDSSADLGGDSRTHPIKPDVSTSPATGALEAALMQQDAASLHGTSSYFSYFSSFDPILPSWEARPVELPALDLHGHNILGTLAAPPGRPHSHAGQMLQMPPPLRPQHLQGCAMGGHDEQCSPSGCSCLEHRAGRALKEAGGHTHGRRASLGAGKYISQSCSKTAATSGRIEGEGYSFAPSAALNGRTTDLPCLQANGVPALNSSLEKTAVATVANSTNGSSISEGQPSRSSGSTVVGVADMGGGNCGGSSHNGGGVTGTSQDVPSISTPMPANTVGAMPSCPSRGTPTFDPFASRVPSLFKDLGLGDDAATPKAPYTVKPPAHFLCPITRHLMKEPVAAADGYLYEKPAIQDWFASNMASPITGLLVEDMRLTPVTPVRLAVRDWAAQHGIAL